MRNHAAKTFWNRPGVWLLAALLAAPSVGHACTLWGAAGAAAQGGTILSKNRDWKPDHIQVLEMQRNGTNYAYLGLYAVGNDAEGIKQGINEKGLTVVTATAGSIPKATREAQPGRGGVMTTLLQRYATCDQILADQKELFSGRKPVFLMISDRKKILVLEVGLKGRYTLKTVTSGTTAHANHFLDASLTNDNLNLGESSTTRVARIHSLLESASGPLDTAAFATMSRDQQAGANNSLWRTGTKSATLSSWIVETPRQGPPRLQVVLADPGEPEQTNTLVLDQKFWRDSHFEGRVTEAKARLQAKAKTAPAPSALTAADFRFDGPLGSEGARIAARGSNTFHVTLSHAPEKTNWANMCQFEITKHAKGVPLVLEAEFNGPEPLYFFDDYFYSWSYDGKEWTPLRWEKFRNGRANRLLFPAFTQDRVLVGHQVPMSAEDAESFLQQTAKHPHAKLQVIGRSLQGRNIYRLEITDPDSAIPRGKRWVHYVKNEHPGEHNAQWRITGMIQDLLSPAAADFRRRAICHFVLIMSPDSPSHGWYRVNAQGVDMNRSFHPDGAASNQVHEAHVCQQDIETLMASSTPVTAFWAMHTWQGRLDVMMTAGPEIGRTLPAQERFAEIIQKNDTHKVVNSVKFTELDLPGSWNQGVRKRLGITSVLCEGGGGIRTRAENVASGVMFMQSLRELYGGTKP